MRVYIYICILIYIYIYICMCIYVSAMMDLRLANNTVAIPVLSLSIYIMVILGLYDILLQGYNGNIPFMPFLKWVQ